MTKTAIKLSQDQETKYSHYHSLDFQNKIYQQKAYGYIKTLVTPQTKILELGCADGSFSQYINEHLHTQNFGLDISPNAIKLAQNKDVIAKIHNLENELPFSDNFFDQVIALEIIEHLFDTDFFLSEIHRVLKPGGYLILSTPNLASLTNRLKLLVNIYPKYLEYSTDGAGHIHLYTLPVLKRQIRKHDFSISASVSPNITCPFITKPFFPKLLRSIAIALGDYFPSLGSHLLVVAQK